ncbi:Uncharacterized protein APZ42_032759 [Daphnia magna]|uniref:Uncharacterized protein n=1 Tax=Daphnia magna TaxID=35525 RepID=A0A164LTZ5_9CRUS|nr:Uncharacterized protein APZ42_032759 [Daphnia magna]
MKSIPVEIRKRVAICVASSNLIDAPYLLRWDQHIPHTKAVMHHHIYRRRRDFPSRAKRFFSSS